MSARVLLIAAAGLLFAAGCANRCDYAQTKCQYECNRNYRICQLHGNEEYYCRNEIGNCTVACQGARSTCHSWMYY
ncbi:hypothetical protein [Candidatus Binatus sp.]|uniref:hypothetical protein n=1 Tax=Candidatus Binatus sp. TaxID=2811406 RepID=UPI003C330049